MAKDIEVNGLDELVARFDAYPAVYEAEETKVVVTSMLILQENVPPYPPKPMNSRYRRTGTLGRSIGIMEGGGRLGFPSIFKVTKIGPHREGHFGTNLNYAPDVIGDKSQQDPFFAAYWWRLEQVIGPSYNKIKEAFNVFTGRLAKYLEGKGL